MRKSDILVALLCLAVGSYISYVVTFRLFDSDGNGALTIHEIDNAKGVLSESLQRIVSPEMNYKKVLADEIDSLKAHVADLGIRTTTHSLSLFALHVSIVQSTVR